MIASVAACCSLQPLRSAPAVNSAVNPLKMRRRQLAAQPSLMTFVGRDFLPHLHQSADHHLQDVVGVTGKRSDRKDTFRPQSKAKRMNEDVTINKLSGY